MPARIGEVSITGDGLLYLSVSWWATQAGMTAGRDPAIVNDFVIQLPPKTVQQVVRNDQGQVQGEDGQWYDPLAPAPDGGYATTTVTVDRKAYVRQIVVDSFKRAIAARRQGDLTDRRIVRRALTADDDDMADLSGSTVDA